jgi:hypothetical protein
MSLIDKLPRPTTGKPLRHEVALKCKRWRPTLKFSLEIGRQIPFNPAVTSRPRWRLGIRQFGLPRSALRGRGRPDVDVIAELFRIAQFAFSMVAAPVRRRATKTVYCTAGNLLLPSRRARRAPLRSVSCLLGSTSLQPSAKMLASCNVSGGVGAMPRPSPSDRRRKAANQARDKPVRDAAARQSALVEKLIAGALARPRSTDFDIAQALAEFDEARSLALAIQNPGAAARCTAYKCELLGLMVHRSAVAVGSPEHFRQVEDDREVIERYREVWAEKMGSVRADRAAALLTDAWSRYKGDDDDGDVIDVKPSNER